MGYRDLAKDLVKRLEGTKLVGYPDSGGVPTNGTGHTGPEVKIGVEITPEIADHNLDVDLATADSRLAGVCTPNALAALHDHQHAALLSFVFNLGAGKTWTVWKDINTGNLDDVPTQLRRFDKGVVGGELVDIPGLDNRREAEIAYWNTADIEIAATAARPNGPGSGVDQAPPSHTTAAMQTPPTPEPAPPMAKASLIAKATTVVGGAAAAIGSQAQEIHGVVSPYVDGHKLFNTLDTVALGAVIAAGIVGIMIHAHQATARKA